MLLPTFKSALISTKSLLSFFVWTLPLMHQGTKLIPADFIAFKEPLCDDVEQHKILTSNFLAQTNALLVGNIKSDNEIQKNIDGNKPSNTILINRLTPYNLGSLIAMYESKIFAIGSILNIYSFDQWGVELGKSIAKEILLGHDEGLDESTKKTRKQFKFISKNNI